MGCGNSKSQQDKQYCAQIQGKEFNQLEIKEYQEKRKISSLVNIKSAEKRDQMIKQTTKQTKETKDTKNSKETKQSLNIEYSNFKERNQQDNQNLEEDGILALFPEREPSIREISFQANLLNNKEDKLNLEQIQDIMNINCQDSIQNNNTHYNQGLNSNFSFFPQNQQVSSSQKPINSSEVEMKSSMTANFAKGFDTQNDLSKYDSKMQNKIELNMNQIVRNESLRKFSQFASSELSQKPSTPLRENQNEEEIENGSLDPDEIIQHFENDEVNSRGGYYQQQSPVASEKFIFIQINNSDFKNILFSKYLQQTC